MNKEETAEIVHNKAQLVALYNDLESLKRRADRAGLKSMGQDLMRMILIVDAKINGSVVVQ